MTGILQRRFQNEGDLHGQLPGVTEEDLYLGVNRAQCSLIRTDADELTIPCIS